jgi:two-component system, chemotaxis family, protein-glutamate methylesterase/glutaminase
MDVPRANRQNIIVIGGSAGALEPLERILGSLPASLPAAVFVVLHIAPYAGRGIFDRVCAASPMRAGVGSDGAPFIDGDVILAPPDHHLIVKSGHVRVTRGPRENLWRPSIDVLFRSAAVAYGSRVIGVILSGALDDGSAGLSAVKRCGGRAIVQTPADAEVTEMPLSAIRNVQVDHVLDAGAIASCIRQLAHAAPAHAIAIPQDLVLETQFAETALSSAAANQALGDLTEFTCAECAGPLWKRHGDMLRYRCMTGHALTARSLDEGLNRNLDAALWAAIRQFEQRANLCGKIAADERARGRARAASSYEEREHEARGYAQTLRRMLEAATRQPEATPPSRLQQAEPA